MKGILQFDPLRAIDSNDRPFPSAFLMDARPHPTVSAVGKRRFDPVRLAVAPLLVCLTDERLLELARTGHEPAFEALFERYRRPLLRYCGGLLPPSRAEDAVQQTFLGCYRAISDGEPILRLRPWIYRAAHNACIDALRQNGWDSEPIEKGAARVELTDEVWESRENLRELVASLQALPPGQRDAILLRELEGYGHEEIAGMLGLSESAARQAIHRARSALRSGVSALAPVGLLESILTAVRAEPVSSRIPELVAGGGSAGALAKLGAAGAVAGALALSGAQAPVPSEVKHKLSGPEAAEALPTRPSGQLEAPSPARDTLGQHSAGDIRQALTGGASKPRDDDFASIRVEIGYEGGVPTEPAPKAEPIDGPATVELPPSDITLPGEGADLPTGDESDEDGEVEPTDDEATEQEEWDDEGGEGDAEYEDDD
jgi:RNA polymerase sigma-70 factor (ECF subfamily)